MWRRILFTIIVPVVVSLIVATLVGAYNARITAEQRLATLEADVKNLHETQQRILDVVQEIWFYLRPSLDPREHKGK